MAMRTMRNGIEARRAETASLIGRCGKKFPKRCSFFPTTDAGSARESPVAAGDAQAI